jgi:hypothetical protein
MENKTLTDSNGGTYVVISAFGWCQDANPFRAFMNLADRSYVTGSFPKAKDRKSDGSLVERADDGIMVYYVKDESEFQGTNWYRPVDRNNNPVGILVYGGDSNVSLVASLENAVTRTQD